ncbi:MAG: nitrilase-related carbon-nitrogen hydrolase [Spirochaetota bacterium]
MRYSPSIRRLAALASSFVVLAAATVGAEDGGGALRVAAVQTEVSQEDYLDARAFEAYLERLVSEAERRGADLVVFPEYINVFLLFEEHKSLIASASSADEALERLASRGGEAPDSALQTLVRRRAPSVERFVRRMWSGLAREYDVSIVAGTYFAPDGEHGLRNRALVFDGDGGLIHAQDKVFLTAFEERTLGLAEGELQAAKTFEIDGVEIGLTICRDSFFSDWEPVLGDADLWLELRANGEVYTDEVRRRFEGALAERVEATSVDLGVGASLSGRLLDFVWEGPAYVVDEDGRRVLASDDVRGNSVLITEVGRSDGTR